VSNLGIVVLRDRSRISDNTAHVSGGGVVNGGELTLHDGSSISGNRVLLGGGPYSPNGVGGGVSGPVSLHDHSVVTENFAESGGGGVYSRPGRYICAPAEGANIYGNAPDDCLAIP
jgi:hypothetical protein